MAATNVQAFSGDLDIAGAITSNLEVGTSNLFVDTESGNVGIGTTNPTSKLSIYGSISIHDDDTPDSRFIGYYDDEGTQIGFVGQGGSANKDMYVFGREDSNTFIAAGNEVLITASSNGKVGIGTNDPQAKLHVENVSANSGNQLGLVLSDNQGGNSTTTLPAIGFAHSSGTIFRGGIQMVSESNNLQKGMIFRCGRSGSLGGFATHPLNSVPERMRINRNGNVGILKSSPSTKLHVYNSFISSGGTIVAEGAHANDVNARQLLEAIGSPAMIMPVPDANNADDVVIYWKGSSGSEYKIDLDGATFFTGQHAGVPENYDLKSNVSTYAGLIVSPSDTGYKSYNHRTGVAQVGQKAIEINECLPYIKLSEKAYDKSVFGVLSNAKNNSPHDDYGNLERDDDPNKLFSDTLRDRVRVNSLGEGAIWVTDLNGNLENGDYITSSNVCGYGMKQDSEFLANYTVAKITMSCDFNPNTIPVKRHKKVFKTNKYWVKYGTYEEVEYEVYEDTPEDQRKMQTIQEFFNTETNEPPISLADYNTLDESNAATYTSEFRDQYLTRGVDKRPYEKPPPEKMRKDFEVITVDEYVDDLDENGVVILEDVPGETELEYKIRYLDMDGNIVDESNASCKAAFVGCTYHCG